MEKIIINTDGASRGNPGKSAASFIIKDASNNFLAEDGVYLGVATNNEAEYKAVIIALEYLAKSFSDNFPLEVEVRSDSRLIVEQLCGRFKIKNDRMWILFDKVKELEKKIGQVKYVQVPRRENFRADQLANQVLDRNLD